MAISRPTRKTQQSGFTLLEMLISMALLLTLSGAILGGMATMQKNYRSNEIRTILNGQMRATLELMAQEIGQAGLPPSGMSGNSIYVGSGAAGAAATVTPAVTANATTAQTVAVTNATVQTNQIVIADTGASAEAVTIQNTSGNPVNQITAIFKKSHTANFNLYPHGVYPQGITFKTMPPTTLTAGASTGFSNTSLISIGDITGTGKLSIVEYSCPIANAGLTGGTAPSTGNLATVIDSNNVQWGPLLRTEYSYSDASNNGNDTTGTWTAQPPATLLALVRVATTANGTPADGCRFDYNIFSPATTATGCTTWWMVTSVNVTVVGESQSNDPQTNSPLTITKSFMNIQPRNILDAYNLYNYNNTACGEFLSIPTAVVTEIGTFTQ